MNWLQLPLLSLYCTCALANSVDEQSTYPSKQPSEFTFDLSDPQGSNDYLLSTKSASSTSLTVVTPLGGSRMTKLVDGTETLLTLASDQHFSRLVFIPSKNPTLASVTFYKNNTLVTRRFRKLFGWIMISLDHYNEQYFKLSTKSAEVPLDLSNVNKSMFNVKVETYSGVEFYTISGMKGYRPSKVLDGNQLVWQAESDERLSTAYLSVNTVPRLLTVSLLNQRMYKVKNYTSFKGKFVEVNRSEFEFVLRNFTRNVESDVTLDTNEVDLMRFEVSLGTLEGVDFVSVTPRKGFNMDKVRVGEYLLWSKSDSESCSNVSFTLNNEPRLYNLLLSNSQNRQSHDRSTYAMKANNHIQSMTEEEYTAKLASLTTKHTKEEVFNLNVMLDSSKLDTHTTLAYTPTKASRVTRVMDGEELLWASNGLTKLENLYFFKTDEKYMAQLTVADDNKEFTTLYFQSLRPQVQTEGKEERDSWRWISSPDFFRGMALSQLVKSYLSLDVTKAVDSGAFEHKTGKLGNVVVKTYAAYPNHSVTSVFEDLKHVWSASNGDELLGLSMYGLYKKGAANEESKKNLTLGQSDEKEKLNLAAQDFNMAELFVKNDNKVTRQYYVRADGAWKSVEGNEFSRLYDKFQ